MQPHSLGPSSPAITAGRGGAEASQAVVETSRRRAPFFLALGDGHHNADQVRHAEPRTVLREKPPRPRKPPDRKEPPPGVCPWDKAKWVPVIGSGDEASNGGGVDAGPLVEVKLAERHHSLLVATTLGYWYTARCE